MRISAIVAAGLLLVGVSVAADVEAAIRKTTSIGAQGLAPALETFARERDFQILYMTSVVNDLRTNGAVGELTVDETLTQLLAGTGLTFRYVDEMTVTISRQAGAGVDASSSFASEAQPSLASSREGNWQVMLLAQQQADEVFGQAGESTVKPAADESASVASQVESDRVVGMSASVTRLGEIVVTAQKREERLRDVPQSVTALSADALTRAGISQFRDYADTVPGLAYNTTGAGYTQIVLRGVTTGFETGATVAIYVDEVPYGGVNPNSNSTRLALDAGLFDLDRIEVLRGPQGTLYGASAVGGLVKYVSKRPSSDQFEGQAQLGLASTEQGDLTRNIAGAVNLPISEGKAGVRLSGFYNHDGGYIDNLSLNKDDVNQANIYGGRADLLLTPTERFSARLAVYAQDISRDGTSSADFTVAGSPMDTDLTQRRPAAEPFDQKFRLASATLNYNFDWADLTSISSYQEVDTRFVEDQTNIFAPFLSFFYDRFYSSIASDSNSNTDTFSQEIRLARARSDVVEWVFGGFYTNEESERPGGFLLRDSAGQPATNDLSESNTLIKYSEYAGFATMTWHLSDKLDVSGGIRYSEIHQKLNVSNTGLLAPPDPTPETKSDANATTYLANARFTFNDQSMIYTRYATGYRPGGPNLNYIDLTTGESVPVGPYESDSLRSYEVGFRHETADHRFSMDIAAYYIDWKDIIINVYDATTGAGYLDNAAGMKARGGELALTARPVSSLTLAASMAYTDAYMAEDNVDLGAVKGERMPTSPRFNGSLTGDYVFSDVHWQPTLGAAFRYMGDRKASFDQSPGFPQYIMDAYTAVDLHAGLSFARYDVRLYVHNLLDERGQVSAYTYLGNPRVAMLQPRTIGLTVTTRF